MTPSHTTVLKIKPAFLETMQGAPVFSVKLEELPFMEEMFRVGVITSTHGLRGEVKVYPTTDSPDRYDTLRDVILMDGENPIPLSICSHRYFKNMVIVRFEGIGDISGVEKFVKKELYVTRENAVPLEEGEYYLADLIGMQVFDEDGKLLGTLDDVLQTGANDVYIVKKDRAEILIPNIPDCILDVNIEEGTMKVHLLPGLI